jgi:RimJ/RimL family protein N-acetyltransferase
LEDKSVLDYNSSFSYHYAYFPFDLRGEMEVHPVCLNGRIVRLEPLSEKHVPELTLSAQDESIWQFMVAGFIRTEDQMRVWVLEMLENQRAGTDLPFAVISCVSGMAIGTTRYLDISPKHRSLEIGGTWYAASYQRTGVNTEAKYLLLKHAFEELGCVRVQIKTDSRNQRSQRAIERIGAVREGLLRNHMILPNGYVRDSIVYSVIDSEWPSVKERLEAWLLSQASP